ncbi:unnamed protein product [Pleuronectes platessa]|uniref:Uncharacterized protein n=1 Tax=Pleuronectes platessa TaxID=8262 RepID=A0A9N7VTD9_PLEPL|nr:unnamed protein product [Pleuronectes platessa]
MSPKKVPSDRKISSGVYTGLHYFLDRETADLRERPHPTTAQQKRSSGTPDAFGTLSHNIMLRTLEEIHLPQPFVDIITDVYKGSFLQVICGDQLTEPVPLQGYADDVEMSSRDESVITNMLGRTDEFLLWSKLEVKHTKCAVLYERRSGGNRWYKANYETGGHQRSGPGKDTTNLFANVHIPQNVLQDMNNKTVEAVRRWLGLNTHTTRDILFLSHKEGGLGVPNVEWTYTTTRLTHLIRMLNNDEAAVRELARASLLLDLRRRKVPLANAGQEKFLGFRRKGNGKLDTQAAGYGCRSDWPDLNDLCNRVAVRLKWVKGNSPTAPDASDAVVTDPAVNVEATVYHNGTQQTLHNTTARKSLLNIKQAETKQHWTGLRLQGKVAGLDFADHSVSHTMYRDASVGEDILCFTVKARLQSTGQKSHRVNTTVVRTSSNAGFTPDAAATPKIGVSANP